MNIRVEAKSKPDNYSYDLYLFDELVSDSLFENEDGIIQMDYQEPLINDNLMKLRGSDLPMKLQLYIYDGSDEHFFNIMDLARVNNQMILSFWTPFQKVNQLPVKEKKLYHALRPLFDIDERIRYEINEDFDFFDNHFIHTHITIEGTHDTLPNYINKSRNILDSILNHAIDNLNGFEWKPIYESNERIFTKEAVIPLLRKLGFDDVRYTHGTKEYGRDIIFSKPNAFNEKKFAAVQVKAGDLTGKVRGQIDEIIQQLDDAFSMPLTLLNEANEVYISEMIIVTSGRITENAKQKIKHKVNKIICGSLTFLDREAIMNLFLKINKTDNRR